MKDSTLIKILQSKLPHTADDKLEKFCSIIAQNSDSSVKELLLATLYEDIVSVVKGQWYKFPYHGHINKDSYAATADINLASDDYIYGELIGNAYSSSQFQPWNYMMQLKTLYVGEVNGTTKLIYDDFNINLLKLRPNDIDNIEEIIASLDI